LSLAARIGTDENIGTPPRSTNVDRDARNPRLKSDTLAALASWGLMERIKITVA
jgi:hypothetical protein